MSGPHKKGGHEEGGGHAPAWIVSFADMVILLMSFFVLLLCKGEQKTTSDDDLLKILASVKLQFGYTPKPNSTAPIDIAVMQVLSQKKQGGFLQNGQNWRSAASKGRQDKERDNWVKAQSPVGKPFYFDRNSAVISDLSEENLEQIAEVVRPHYRMLVIQGHCSQEEARIDPEGGHSLSFRRALAVKNVLRKHGVAEKRLQIVSMSSNAAPNTLKSVDRQLVIVTLGTYFLPTENDVLDERSIDKKDESTPPSHGGH